MTKKAKDFGLQDIAEHGATFEVQKEDKKPEIQEEAIVLDIIGSGAIAIASDTVSKGKKKKLDKARFMQAYQSLNRSFSFKRGVPLQDKALFYELVSTMIAAGVSVVASIRIFAEQTSNKYFQKISEAVSYQLEKGQSFSQALAEYPHIFEEAEIGIIKSAEATGRLNEVLKRLGIQIEQSIELRSKIKSALIYPVIVLVFIIASIYSMLRFVIPQISDLFDQTGLELPWITRFLIEASDFVVNNGLSIVIVTVSFIFAVISFSKTKPGKKIFHTMYLHIPVLKEFQKAINQARFARSISNLLNSGIGIVDSCEITARSISNVVYKEKIRLIANDVSQGISMADSIQDSPYFSNLLVSMFSIGEKTAQLDDLSGKTADYFENKVSVMAENFSKLIQPFIISVVGGMVAAVVLAIMLPMTELLGGIDAL